MKLGVMNPVLYSMEFKDALKYLNSIGVECIEIGAGGSPGDRHLKPLELIDNPDKVEEYKDLLEKYEIEISALSCHGNPVHPNSEIAEKDDTEFRNAILACELLGIDTIIGFSGCPGDSETSQYPNWVTCTWPTDFQKIGRASCRERV